MQQLILSEKGDRSIGYLDAFIIGLAQAVAVIPGISRSGATIATGLMIGNRKEDIAKFSFLMVLVPVIGANIIELISGDFTAMQHRSRHYSDWFYFCIYIGILCLQMDDRAGEKE